MTVRPPRLPAAMLMFCALLAGCGHRRATRPALAAPPSDWRRVATEDDRGRLRHWRQAWTDAMARVRTSGTGGVAFDDALFDPDRALPGPTPPQGRYWCRVTKLGANGAAMRDVTLYPSVECRIGTSGGATTIYKTAGAQRPVGSLYGDGPNRAVFLGALVLGDETKPLAYGQDARRDLAGYVERIGEQRWRLVLPYPRFESLLDVVELTPAPARR